MKIVICGSMAFSKEMVKIANKLKQENYKVILPRNTKEYAEKILTSETSYESTKNKIDNDLIRDYFDEIKNADAVLVINTEKNNIKNYIGGNSFLEMGFAHVLNKKIFLFNDIPEMIYTDEIKAMQPIVLRGDLTKIN
ncbi:hypothetical protein KAI56_03605 [Candidatus Parcubacteria bacterium]|nr:hypothetical protein [Candidatus Parcubacteria bacterium]